MPHPAQHAELSGSTAHRWIRCPGSIRMSRSVAGSGGTSSFAREGIFAHAVAAFILNGGDISPYVENDALFEFEDHGEKLEWPIPTDMLEHVNVYVNRIRRHAVGHTVFIERHVNLSYIREGMFGTLDAGVVKPNILVVSDFKYGHVPVFIIDYDLLLDSTHGELSHVNPQLLYYAAGMAHELDWKHDEVMLEIIQPRCTEVPPIQSTTVPASALKDWAENDLWKAAHLATLEDAPLNAGEWCRFCPALAICPAAQEKVQEMAVADFAEITAIAPEVPDDLDRLSKILKWAPYLDAWLRACEAYAFERMQSGDKVEGFKLVEKSKHRIWPTEDAAKLAKLLKVKKEILLKEPELKSPAQMDKLIGKKVVSAVAVRPPGDLTIAAESDRRDAVSPKGDFEDLL